MPQKKNKFYITTSIAYTNAFPHIGFALELIQADVLARCHRGMKENVFFLTGTDEHGAKVVKAAEAAGKTPEKFTDEISAKFRELAKILAVSNDDFIRTTDEKKHWPSVKRVWGQLKENGDIYKKNYQGLYCVGCEAFITKKDLIEGGCKIHQREPEVIEEENYFFRLSKYQEKIKEAIQAGKIKVIPDSRKNEILSFISQGLEDVSFSRPRKDLKWAIPVPDDDSASVYVWADALTNYISAIGYGTTDCLPVDATHQALRAGKLQTKNFTKYWPADVHCIGKDILKFHAAIWPGMLLSLGLELPKIIFVHGFITVAGQKMSKSLGNVIDPFELVDKYGTDAVRYFLLREIPSVEDGDFTYEKFEQRYNADLAGGLGNLIARVVTLAQKFKIPAPKGRGSLNEIERQINKTQKDCSNALGEFKFNEALVAIWELIGFCDGYIEKERPWSLDPAQDKGKAKEIIGNLLLTIGEIAKLLKPFLPETSEKISEQLKTQKSEPLFPRFN